MIRAFKDEKRIATAVKMAEGKVLQVYPRKQTFESEEAFKASYPEHEFKEETREKSELARTMTKAEAHVLVHTSLQRNSDTALQRVVRQIYFQTGTRDSIRSTAIDWQSSYYSSRADPGIYVQNSTDSVITPVHFNCKSGLVLFNRNIQNNTNPEGMRFFKKDRGDLVPVMPEFFEQQPGQKAIVYDNHGYSTNKNYITQLREAGFHIVHYMSNTQPSLDVQKAMYKMIPNLVAVIMNNIYTNDFSIYPSLEKLNTNNWWNLTRASPAKWIAENK